jgi:2-dehydro-3-deoxygalactonokinase
MDDFADGTDHLCAIYVDLGTTNTRVWLMRGGDVLAQASRQVGVRDSAHYGTTTAVRAALKELIANVQDQTKSTAVSAAPACVIAAGMIGSPLGLAEVAHIPAPAGLKELAGATRRFEFPDVTTLPFLLVPGVRSGSVSGGRRSLDQFDVMRGEETLCVGLHALGLVEPPAVVLTLGSHWKAIQLETDGRIQGSVTSLSGEMIHAVQTQTILASSVTSDWPEKLAPDWLAAGMEGQRRSGLSRALFCVRLLELKDEGTPGDRFAYLLGAFIATDLDALVARGILAGDTRPVISGHTAMAEAWAFALARMSVTAVALTEQETEKAFLAGLNQILIGRILIEPISISGSTNSSAVNPESNWRIENGREAVS